MSLHMETTAQGYRGLEQQICQSALQSLEGSQGSHSYRHEVC